MWQRCGRGDEWKSKRFKRIEPIGLEECKELQQPTQNQGGPHNRKEYQEYYNIKTLFYCIISYPTMFLINNLFINRTNQKRQISLLNYCYPPLPAFTPSIFWSHAHTDIHVAYEGTGAIILVARVRKGSLMISLMEDVLGDEGVIKMIKVSRS